ncbi:MAG: glutamate ligase domain-containing protein, partial [Candidatus Levyibacteriota bacterium]
GGAQLYDDYAHHPTEIKKTLAAARDRFPKSKIICVFQPHTFSRTKLLFEEFSSAFLSADIVVLADIYPSQREAFDPTVSSETLAKSMQKLQKNVFYIPKLADVVQYLSSNQQKPGTVIITMGAGDIYKIADQLLEQ